MDFSNTRPWSRLLAKVYKEWKPVEAWARGPLARADVSLSYPLASLPRSSMMLRDLSEPSLSRKNT